MIELLKLCGFEEQEIESELPRVEKAFQKLDITAEDIERAKQRLAKYYDIELKGVRKMFRLILLELVNALLAKEEGKEKIIYGFMATGVPTIFSALASKSQEVCAVYHSWALHIIVGCVFDKIVPLIEEAEKSWLKAGMVAHCANVKTLLGPIASGLFPRPDLLVTAGVLCETSSKTLDLLHEVYGIPVSYIDTCQDREFWEYADATERASELSMKSMRRLMGKIQEIAGFEITDDELWDVINAQDQMGAALDKVKNLVSSSDPLPLSPAQENIWMCLNSLTLTMDGIAEAVDAINTLYEEVKERVDKGVGVVEKGAPRILAILPAGQTDPRMEQLVTELGIAIVALDTRLTVPQEGKVEDPYMELSRRSLRHSLITSLPRRIPLIIEGCKKLKVDGVLDRFHAGCRAVVGDAIIIKEAVEKELGIPVLLLEWENFDPRVHNHEEFKRRLEVFKTMMVAKAR
jgi:benzoyl-CoA reductase/2-hydroxyglutaryl-CoA dehydratase subunit BcrC/BadD/HgdB